MSDNKYIKGLDYFNTRKDVLEEADITDFFSGMIDIAGDAIQRELKQKVVAYLLKKFGILEKSKLSRVVQEVVEEIPISDYYDIISGETNAEYWAPKIAKAFQGFLLSEGLNTIGESWGIDSTGFLFGTIKEAIEEYFSNPQYQKEFIEGLIGIIAPVLGAEAPFSSKKSSVEGDMKGEIEEFVKNKKPSQKPSKSEAAGLVNSFVKKFDTFK